MFSLNLDVAYPFVQNAIAKTVWNLIKKYISWCFFGCSI